jgi:hypothetical protein
MRAAALLSLALSSATLTGQSTLFRDEIRPLAEAAFRSTVDTSIRNGLAYLARTQDEGGFWTGHVGHKNRDDYLWFLTAAEQKLRGQGHIGVTGLAGLAFLAGGHLPGRGPWGENVSRTLDYVLAHVDENGFISDSGTRMYSHAFATLFLAQIHGMVGEARIRHGLERAVHWVVDCQNQQGGWRYNPFSREADLSVTVCQLQALRAARNIGIRVPVETIDRAVEYVLRSRTRSGPAAGLFYYKIMGRGAYRKNQQGSAATCSTTSKKTAAG